MSLQLIDAHHHLWDLGAVRYPWLEARGVRRFFGDPTPIQRNYLVADLKRDAVGLELLGSVHVQVGCAPGRELDETRWLQRQASEHGLPSAIIASIDLTAADLPHQIAAHRRAAPALRGVRQIIGREPADDARTGSGAILDSAEFSQGLRALAQHDLSFDLQLSVPQIPQTISILEHNSALRVALCHGGSPWDQSHAGLQIWKAGLRALSALPNLVCKLSGFSMFKPDWTLTDFVRLTSAVLEIFGPERCLFGSNYPVDGLHRRYSDIVAATYAAVAPLGDRAITQVFVENARRVYRL